MTPCHCPEWVPLFPLPNAVLLPRAILPLHVFEPRYRRMTKDALKGDRCIAVALLRPGFEANYHTLDSEIHPIVGIGKIMREERLPDGRFNFLLQGAWRGQIIDENRDREYRIGRIKPLNPLPSQPEDECALRRRLRELLETEPIAMLAREANWPQLLACSGYTLSDVVDLIASTVLTRPEDKQCFLSEASVAKRALCMLDVLESVKIRMQNCQSARPARTWPPPSYQN